MLIELRLRLSVMKGVVSVSSTGTVSVLAVVVVVVIPVAGSPVDCGSGATWFGRHLSSEISSAASAGTLGISLGISNTLLFGNSGVASAGSGSVVSLPLLMLQMDWECPLLLWE